jgi:hypothetical protein
VTVRIFDTGRRYVPRRLSVPVEPVGRSIAVFPGAAYGPAGSATGLRGRVVDGAGEVVRWARVRADHGTEDVALGHGHADDRGEFVLVLGSPADLAAPASQFDVRLVVTARTTPPPPEDDILGDLLVEVLPATGAADPVSAGRVAPAAYDQTVQTVVTCRLGRLLSVAEPFQVHP